ncbi:DUF4304 domain-containing protein [Lysobacter silvisoli]|uniref:DUF4304 domain-containing protein n=1 Tax=Lysobacter silvisoli TaxID=2293254 RepID=A0A371JWJ7_9GAMM|nr:DUF4304 domain-containing protein [Lysobacter silvisoli]RDZ26010.1 DUF4304 domain-containing protein [Lysobacter silvisoli]
MDKTPRAREIIQAIAKFELAPALKAEGFKKSNLTFTRRRGLTTQIIKFELSSWNLGPRGFFTVDVLVRFDEMTPPGESPGPYPQFFASLDQLLTDVPRSFEVNADTPVPQASARLTQWIMDGVVAPLNRVNTLVEFESTGWVQVPAWAFPALYAYYVERYEEAERLVRKEAEFFKDRGITWEGLVQKYRFHKLNARLAQPDPGD